MIAGVLRGLVGLIPGVGPFLALVPPGAWKFLAIIGAFAAWTGYVHVHATHQAEAKCDAAAAKAELEKVRIESAAFREQADRAKDAQAQLDAEKSAAENRARDLQGELEQAESKRVEAEERASKQPKTKTIVVRGPCRLDDDAIKRLR